MIKGPVTRTGLPDGVRDVLYPEVVRLRRLEGTLAEIFSRWGYREVVTPAFELLEAVIPGAGVRAQEELYKFIDRRGRILALRPDMTTPIARLVATHLAWEPGPQRFYYSGPVFRCQESRKGRPHEFRQSGIELIGDATPFADAEVIAVAVEALRAAGLAEFGIGVGHVEFLEGLMEQASLPEASRADLRTALAQRNYVAYEQALYGLNLPEAERDVLLFVASASGGREVPAEIASRVSNLRARAALDEMKRLMELLAVHGVQDFVHLDLGLVRDFEYYTGIIFEGYVPGSGSPLCGGGRYDNLLGEFGEPSPATGFALELDGLCRVLERNRDEDQSDLLDYLIVPEPGTERNAIEKARYLRARGHSVIVFSGSDVGEARDYASRRGVRNLLLAGKKGYREIGYPGTGGGAATPVSGGSPVSNGSPAFQGIH